MLRPKRLQAENTGPEPPKTGPTIFIAVLLPAVLAALLLPRPTPFNLNYTTGQPWAHPDLVAPFDFEVMRPEAEAEQILAGLREKQSLTLLHLPDVADQQKEAFSSAFLRQYADTREQDGDYLGAGMNLLDHLYLKGIYSLRDTVLANEALSTEMTLLRNNSEEPVTLGALYNEKEAREFLIDTLPFSPLKNPEILLPLLQEAIRPNIVFNDSLNRAIRERQLREAAGSGIFVRKNDLIVARNQIVTPEIAARLHTLAARNDAPPEWRRVLGYALLGLLAFGSLAFAWRNLQPLESGSRESRLFLPVLLLLFIAALSFLVRFHDGLPLILPLYALPAALAGIYPRRIALGAAAVLLLLPAAALSWGTTWVLTQAAALAGMPPGQPRSLRRLAAEISLALTLQIAALQASDWCGISPDTLALSEAWPFVLAGGLCAMGILTMKKYFVKNLP